MRPVLLLLLVLSATTGLAQERFDKCAIDHIAGAEAMAHHGLHRAMPANPGRGFDMSYHRLDVLVDPAIRAIHGSVTHHFHALEDLQEVLLDLSSALQVSSVTRAGVPLSFDHTGDALNILLNEPLPTGTLDSITITYGGEPPETGFGSFVQALHADVPVIWTLSQPYGSRDWWPCKEDLQDKADSVDIIVTTTTGNRVASNGLLITEDPIAEGFVRFHWRHRYPVAHYLVAFAVTNYEVFHTQIEVPGAVIPMETWAYPEDAEIMQLNAGDIQVQMPLFHELFGMYPFASEKYGHAQFTWGGGMEHQTMSFMGYASFELAAHELAHQWFGNKVTCGSWSDIWLNEGFASYLTGLCYDFLGPVYWHPWKAAQISDIVSQPDGSVFVYGDDTLNISRLFNTRLTYRKGAFVLHMLRWIMGDDDFFLACRNYLNDPELAYSSAGTADLRHHMEQVSGLPLEDFFNDWIYAQGHPSYLAEWSQDANGSVTLALWQTPSHPSVSFFKLPVPLTFSNGEVDTVVVADHHYSGQTFTFHLPFEAAQAQIDPDQWLISGQNMVLRVPYVGYEGRPLLYPVPATEVLTVYRGIDWAGEAHVRIFDAAGRLVHEQGHMVSDRRLRLPTEHLAAGAHILEIVSNNEVLRSRFIRE